MSHNANGSMDTKKLKKNDALLVGGLLVICLSAFLFFRVATASAGYTVTITVDGKKYGTYDLKEPREIPVVSEGVTTNVVVIENGKAYMKEASCPDHLCMMQGKISHSNESIICLPNRVVVTVNGDEPEFDSMTD